MATYYVDGAVGSDSNAGTSEGAGNAWLTISKALSTMADGDDVWVKASATYSISTGLTYTHGFPGKVTRVMGYTSTTGDGGQATILATAAITGVTMSGYYGTFENFILDGNSLTGTTGIAPNYQYAGGVLNCIVKNWSSFGIVVGTAKANILRCEVTGCGGGISAGSGAYLTVDACDIHANTSHGISIASNSNFAVVTGSLIHDNTGGSTDGINHSPFGSEAVFNQNTIHGNGRDGLRINTYNMNLGIRGNIFTSNGGYGINNPASPGKQDAMLDYNAFYNNTSGSYSSGVLAGPHDVALSGLPYTNGAGGDFSLNNVAGQGAACRGVSFPGTFP